MMMRKKQLFYIALTFIIVLPSFLSHAALANDGKSEGKVTSKEEVVYATLTADGNLDNIYVVNTLDVARAGKILDLGVYSSVKNLTDLSKLDQKGQTVRMDAPEGKFYYQGNMNDETEIPWDVKVSYSLDGHEMKPPELAGKTGHLEIKIDTAKNNDVDSVFYDNYLLQVSLKLPNTYQNIEASDGMIANAGKNKQITFTVMPGKEEKLTVEADVKDFEFQGVEIAAVPSTVPIDTSKTENMTEDMSELPKAIGKLNNGVSDLKDGVSDLNNGAANLSKGSANYKNGINQLDSSSSKIVGASNSIGEALKTINRSLPADSGELDLSGLKQLPDGLRQLADGLTKAANGLSTLQENYAKAYGALDGAIVEIPAEQVSKEEIAELYASGADPKVVDKLVDSYKAAQKVKGTYSNVKGAFAAVEPTLNEVSGSVQEMSKKLNSIADDLSGSLEGMDMSGLSELKKGISSLSSNYSEFHSGLVNYTGGVSELSSSYNKLHSGIDQLAGGTGGLKDGVGELHNGTKQLHQETKDLPEQMQKEIDQMIQEYDKSDFKPVSFVSSKNENVSSVQFVIKTKSIEKEEKETRKKEPEEKKGFWEKLKALF
ncbi:YhgE/Pip domain-containing protein [Alkalihalobacillus sp. EGI L200015]|nr:YhgE/Pip domain-containing protein [Pseudalkalibacillus salsuginis]